MRNGRIVYPRQADIGLALLRAVIGAVFVAHGIQKLFIFGVEGVEQGFSEIGIPYAAVAARAVAFTEFVGGLLLVTGLLTRFAAGALTVVMLGAMWYVHVPNGFFLPNGYEFVLTLLAVLATLVITGPGLYSLDALMDLRRRRGELVVERRHWVRRAA